MADTPVVLLNRGEAAALLHVSRRTVERYGKAGLIEERRIGPKLIMITASSVTAMIAGRKDAAA
ncbi:MAG TPA: helix-turn-helix domain-containing protein [Streptosporangiaceae bacterium]|nr:helix-turn-helix domain-containing protein [Streptosporangiaceae bacterium]